MTANLVLGSSGCSISEISQILYNSSQLLAHSKFKSFAIALGLSSATVLTLEKQERDTHSEPFVFLNKLLEHYRLEKSNYATITNLITVLESQPVLCQIGADQLREKYEIQKTQEIDLPNSANINKDIDCQSPVSGNDSAHTYSGKFKSLILQNKVKSMAIAGFFALLVGIAVTLAFILPGLSTSSIHSGETLKDQKSMATVHQNSNGTYEMDQQISRFGTVDNPDTKILFDNIKTCSNLHDIISVYCQNPNYMSIQLDGNRLKSNCYNINDISVFKMAGPFLYHEVSEVCQKAFECGINLKVYRNSQVICDDTLKSTDRPCYTMSKSEVQSVYHET